jgi:release factor glutamine methyltransferase
MPSIAMESQTARPARSARPTLRMSVRDGSRFLSLAAVASARLDAEVLLRHVVGIDKAQLYLRMDEAINAEAERPYWELLQRRARREPLAYITGRKEFWSLDFSVTPDVLIPRPETELLVEVALERIRQRLKPRARIIDLGTGSGAIAVCLAKELPEAQISAIDISSAALQVARANAERHGVDDQIRFLHGDLFAPLAEERERFDLMVANPPYVRSGDVAKLEPEIREWEPMAALDGGRDGLDIYRRIASQCREYLTAAGDVVLEIADGTGDASAQIFANAGGFEPAALRRDYAGKDRVMATRKSSVVESAAKGLDRG